MLSGSWRKAAVPPAGSRGSNVLVEAQYEYEYRATDGKMVSIREGERFVLLCKSTEDWWQVRRLGDPPKAKPIYVPATYVTEVASTVKLVPRTTLSPCSQSHCTGSKAFCRSMEDLNSNSTFRSGGGARFPTLPLQDPHAGHQGGSFLLLPSRSDAPITRSRSSSVLPQNPYREVTEEGPCQPKQKSYSQGDILNEEPPQKHILEVETFSPICVLEPGRLEDWSVLCASSWTFPFPASFGKQYLCQVYFHRTERQIHEALQEKEEKLNLDHSQWEDIHVITGALKLFFRELPEPLVPYSFFDEFVETVKMSDNTEKVAKLKLLVENLPPANHDTMKYMFRHLKRQVKVNELSDLNRMSPQNISIVFGPTLMRPEKDFANIAINMVYQNQVVEDILSECDTIFGQGRDFL
ncbi:UNVERIFIED_CONTAM: hypothetical protein FKN15_001006 [Acipenser sinensis]